jgi:tRNA threonylcarbamoyladenosine modification (KEOPS) complex  Pcc1 subunit
MRASARIVLALPRGGRLETVLRALGPEVERPVTVRSGVSLAREDACLVLRVEARDTVALRATLNAYLRWISSLLHVLDVLDARSA